MHRNKRKLNVIELYAGTGRSVEPFRKWKRATISLLVDSSNLAHKTYRTNYANAPYVRRSLLHMTSREIVAKAGGRIDVLLGCPPCQGFSESGKRNPNDPLNSHMTRFAGVIEATRPLAVALENVPVAASSREYRSLIEVLERGQYRWTSLLANAIQYGSCQSRQRLLLVAVRKDVGVDPTLAAPTHGNNRRVFSYATGTYRSVALHQTEMLGIAPSTQRLAGKQSSDWSGTLGNRPAKTLWECIGNLPSVATSEARRLHHAPWQHSASLRRRMARIAEGAQWSGSADYFSQSYGRLHRNGFARTITGYFPYAGCGRFWHPIENRSLTLREAARIQGFPDSFIFTEQSQKAAKLVGNALDSVFASICYESIRSALE
jgi:DNA (cytosine-5)-methyltransferase 1